MATDSIAKRPSTRWAMAALSFSALLSSLGTSIANVGLPAMAQAFEASLQGIQWIVVAYLLAITTLMIPAGRLGDQLGHRRLLLAGILLFTIASVFCGLAPTLWLLVAARAAQGIGAAFMIALTLVLAGELGPKNRTGNAMGLLGTMSAIGTALGPSFGGALIAVFGWRAIFLVNVPMGLLTFALAHRCLPADRDEPLTASGSGLIETPLLQLMLARLRDRTLGASLAMNAAVSAVMMATLVAGPFYLSRTLGLETALVGVVMSIGPLSTAIFSVFAGRLVDRIGSQRMITAGLGAMVAGAFLLAVLPPTLGVPGYLAPIAVLTLGYALFQTSNNTAVMIGVAAGQRGMVSGMLNLSRNLGLVTGASALGAVFAATGMQATFALATLLILITFVIASRAQHHTQLQGRLVAAAESRQ